MGGNRMQRAGGQRSWMNPDLGQMLTYVIGSMEFPP